MGRSDKSTGVSGRKVNDLLTEMRETRKRASEQVDVLRRLSAQVDRLVARDRAQAPTAPPVRRGRGQAFAERLSLAASIATVIAVVYAAISLNVSVDAAQRDSVTQTFETRATVCGFNPGDGTVIGSIQVNTVLTNTGRLPITVLAIFSDQEPGSEAQFSGIYLDGSGTTFINEAFRLDVGQAVALTALYESERRITGSSDDPLVGATNTTTISLSNGRRVTAHRVISDGTPERIRQAYQTTSESFDSYCDGSAYR